MAAGEFTPPNPGASPVPVIDAHDEAITPRKNLAFLDDEEQTSQQTAAEQIKKLTLEFEAADQALLWQTKRLNFEKGRIFCDLKDLLLEQKRGAWQAWLDDHKLPRQTAEDGDFILPRFGVAIAMRPADLL